MGRIAFAVDTPVAPERMRAAILDFSERRPALWPGIDPKLYRVHSVGAESADVQEGSRNPFVRGGVWVRERYDWSTPGLVRATTQDSNVFRAGSLWQMRITPANRGGSHLEVLYDRQAKNAQGRVIGVLITLVGKPVLMTMFKKTLKALEREQPAIAQGS